VFLLVRHLWTLIAAAVTAPLAWVLVAFGEDRSALAFTHAERAGAFDTGDFLRPVLLLAAGGLLVGVLATLRFSPAGAGLLGLGYAGCYALLLVAPDGVMRLFRHRLSLAGHSADMSLPLQTGTALLLGAVFLVGLASVSRWRRWPRAGEASDSEDERPELPLLLPKEREEPEVQARFATGTMSRPKTVPSPPARGSVPHWAASLRSGGSDDYR
jgi:hypothetical protein